MNYNYLQQQQYMPSQNQNQRYYWQTPPTPTIRPVSSIDEVKASPIDFDGSVFYFPDLANKRIYTKQINMDGTATICMYELKELPQVPTASHDYITREEFEYALSQLRTAVPVPQAKSESIQQVF